MVSCKKEVLAPNLGVTTQENTEATTPKTKSPNSKSGAYGNPDFEDDIYNLASSTDDYFEGQNPTVGDWLGKFHSDYSTTLTIPTSTPNEDEFNSVTDLFLNDYFSSNFTRESNSFRDSWLSTIAKNQVLNDDEKDLISNMVYIGNGFGHNLPLPHTWDNRWANCMKGKVPGGPFAGFFWAIRGGMFIDTADCIGRASGWW